MNPSRSRRCLLFVPGDQEDKIRKAAGLACDAVILDLEDAVTAQHKDAARETAVRLLRELDFGPRERLLRVNAVSSQWGRQDLVALRDSSPDTVMVPKVDGPEQLSEVVQALGGRPIDLVAAIESARGLIAAPAIAATSGVTALIFGDGDYLADTGGRRSQQSLLYPRSALVAAAAAAGIVAIDTPYLGLGDLAGLREDAFAAADLGFAGKAAIHPEQLAAITEIFTPTAERVAWAERILAAAEGEARGAFVVDGVMVDAMTVRTAQRVLAAAPSA